MAKDRAVSKEVRKKLEKDIAAPCVKIQEKDGEHHIQLSPSIRQTLEGYSADFLTGTITALAELQSDGGKADERSLGWMLSVVQGVAPTDEVEVLLAAQMATIHMASMKMARRLAHSETIAHQDSAERALNKLARTFTAQVEALRRYRTGGAQTIRVERVDVHKGGQAIVGAVTHGGEGHSKNRVTTP